MFDSKDVVKPNITSSVGSYSNSILFTGDLPLLFLCSVLFFRPISFHREESVCVSRRYQGRCLSSLRPPTRRSALRGSFTTQQQVPIINMYVILSYLKVRLFSGRLLPASQGSMCHLRAQRFSRVHRQVCCPARPFMRSRGRCWPKFSSKEGHATVRAIGQRSKHSPSTA